jgi:beta-aspartyl-peptidase (threonine type)
VNDQRGSELAVVTVAVILLFVVLIGGGIAFLLWQQSNRTQEFAVLARMEAEQQRAIAERAAAESVAQAERDARIKSSGSPNSTDEIAAIQNVLAAQQAAWNDGDIDAFMETYWKSEELTFSSGGSTTRSWQSTLDRYKTKYATREAMGTLEFSDLQVRLLAPNAAMVLGRWDLKDKAGGNFTLVMQKLSSGWVIVHDHTSAKETSLP